MTQPRRTRLITTERAIVSHAGVPAADLARTLRRPVVVVHTARQRIGRNINDGQPEPRRSAP